MTNKNIGEMISSLRKEKGMTQSDLAEKMNVTDKNARYAVAITLHHFQ